MRCHLGKAKQKVTRGWATDLWQQSASRRLDATEWHLPYWVLSSRPNIPYFNTPPWSGKTPIASVNFECNGLASGFVKMSARFEAEGT